MQEENFSITNKTKSTLPRVSFVKIKNAIIGKNYRLSVVFIGKDKSKKLNFTYRGKNKPTNILSFPLDKKTGEIFITLDVAKKETKSFDKNLSNFVAFLFIHGVLHLKGMTHGSRMERKENEICKKFGI